MSPAPAKLAQQVGVCVSFQTWGGESEILSGSPGSAGQHRSSTSLFLSLHTEEIIPPRAVVASEEMDYRWRVVGNAGNLRYATVHRACWDSWVGRILPSAVGKINNGETRD